MSWGDIQKNIREVKNIAPWKDLKDIPSEFWTQILRKKYVDESTRIHIDQNHNFVTNINPISSTMYLHVDEPDPEPIHRVNFEEQPICILCDKLKKPSQEIELYESGRMIISKTVSDLYICDGICTHLTLKYYADMKELLKIRQKELGKKLKDKPMIKGNFLGNRYTKNRLLCLYKGLYDPHCSFFSILTKDIIYYIISVYVELF
jgi:hypothetical protein